MISTVGKYKYDQLERVVIDINFDSQYCTL